MWGGIFLEGGLVNFLLLSTVNTGALDHGCVAHNVCTFELVRVHSCVFTFAFSRGPTCGRAKCGLTQDYADTSISIEWFWYAVFDYLTEVFRGRGGPCKRSFIQAFRTFTCMIFCVPTECKSIFCCWVVCCHFLKRQHGLCV